MTAPLNVGWMLCETVRQELESRNDLIELGWAIWETLSLLAKGSWNSELTMDRDIGSTLPNQQQRSSFCSAAGIKVPKIKIFLEQSNTGRIFRKDKMPTHKSYHSYLIESLKDPAEAAAYLDAVLEDGDLEHILLALKNVAEARRSLIDASNKTDSNWENCYQSFAQGEVPGLLVIAGLLNKLGLKLSVTVKEEQAAMSSSHGPSLPSRPNYE